MRRVFSLRRMLRLVVAGTLGDLFFLPDLVALSNSFGAYPAPAAFVFFSGFWSVYAGVAAAYRCRSTMRLSPSHSPKG